MCEVFLPGHKLIPISSHCHIDRAVSLYQVEDSWNSAIIDRDGN